MNTARPVHPGEILREEFLAPRDLSVRALAIALQVPAPHIRDLVREKCGLAPDIAQRLASYFDTAPQFWTSLQTSYYTRLARQKSKGCIAK